jgi:hypothetical protein
VHLLSDATKESKPFILLLWTETVPNVVC